MMNLIEKATIIHYHRHRINIHGQGTFSALGWRAEESQLKRFEVLSNVGILNGCSILDIGCGYGDMKGYLDQRYSDFTYIGIDLVSEFIVEAKKKYKECANTFFYQTDFDRMELPRVDYVFACGSLNYRCDDPDYFTHMIQKMYEAAMQAVAFNMLDAEHFPTHPLLVGHDFAEVVAFCNSLSRYVKVIRGYLDDDFTVFIYRK